MDPFLGRGLFLGMPPLFTIFFLFILGLIIFSIIQSAKNYHKNATSPILTQHARLVAKRTEVRHYTHHTSDNNINGSSITYYYATFETDAGQRFELTLSGKEFGLLSDGDVGELTYQGEWFKAFKREMY
ncbi:DUF2500 family protein [Clostridium bovifaecis]|uniref:DUF2500 family protein n=1 Tax=Clostridium bovifaecis TaxID=2184719 RepID=A0A6I6F0Q0_9CLOT|nr:DUF2500 family protein [Clostridium bovifaecis]